MFKYLIIIFYLLSSPIFAQNTRYLSIFDELRVLNESLKKEQDLNRIKYAKYALIEGKISLAKYYLNKVDISKSQYGPIKRRYVGMIAFLEGDYKKAYEVLEHPEMNTIAGLKSTCILRSLTLMSLFKEKELRKLTEDCNTILKSKSTVGLFWQNQIFDLFLTKSEKKLENILSALRVETLDTDLLRVWIKLGIYLNKEKIIAKLLKRLPDSAYRSNNIRELIALIYYRIGDEKEAKKFIEDINGQLAENIRGNISLNNNDYEVAFGHFQLALKRKSTSLNALERSIPLAWKLEKWKKGIDLLTQLNYDDLKERDRQALKAAFKIRLGKNIEAKNHLRYMEKLYGNNLPHEGDVMMGINSLILNDDENFKLYSDKACRNFDGTSCWLLHQTLVWSNFGKLSNIYNSNKEVKISFADESIDSLRNEKEITGLDEEVLIDQQDIEELDSSVFNLEF